jgi:hypothetical protein
MALDAEGETFLVELTPAEIRRLHASQPPPQAVITEAVDFLRRAAEGHATREPALAVVHDVAWGRYVLATDHGGGLYKAPRRDGTTAWTTLEGLRLSPARLYWYDTEKGAAKGLRQLQGA